MTWICLEGVDRTGKSSVAEYYKTQGYEVVHMNAPDKKYSEPGYTGPGYVDELLETYMQYDGKKVIFDRTIYGEKVWPTVFGRKSKLSDEDFDALKDFEDQNDTQYILMHDPNFEAHWQRCVDCNEPLTRSQFNTAIAMYERLINDGFEKRTLPDFNTEISSLSTERVVEESDVSAVQTGDNTKPTTDVYKQSSAVEKSTPVEKRLQKANAINTILSSRIVKRKGDIFDDLEKDIRNFLNSKLDSIFGNEQNKTFTDEQVLILKSMADRIVEKQKGQK